MSDHVGDDPTPHAGSGAPRRSATQLASDPAFTSTYALIGEVPRVTPVVFAGDSITTTTSFLSYAGAAALGAYPNGRVDIVTGLTVGNVDAGVTGNTSAQLLARFDTDVIARNPRLVHILIGTNDAGSSVPVATTAANIRGMVAKCRAIGARVVLGTVPPTASTSPTDRKARVIALNQWICRYALSQNIRIADYYGALVDTTTGAMASGYDVGDGIHPSPAGTGVMAAELVATMQRQPSAAVLLAKDANDPWNFTRNALFLSAFGTGWSNPVVTGLTTSTVSGDANIKGNWGKLAAVATASTSSTNQSQTTTQGGTAFTAGNWMMLGLRLQSSALSSGQSWSPRLRTTNGAYDIKAGNQTKIAYTGNGGLVFVDHGPAAPALTSVQGNLDLTAGTGDAQIAQWTMYDLTAMGVTDASGNLV